VYVLLGDLVPVKERAMYMSGVGAFYALSTVAGPLIGGAFTDKLSWR
jgi:MFS family permease